MIKNMKLFLFLTGFISVNLIFAGKVYSQDFSELDLDLVELLTQSDAVVRATVVEIEELTDVKRRENGETRTVPYMRERLCVHEILWGTLLLDRNGCLDFYVEGSLQKSNYYMNKGTDSILFIQKSDRYYRFVVKGGHLNMLKEQSIGAFGMDGTFDSASMKIKFRRHQKGGLSINDLKLALSEISEKLDIQPTDPPIIKKHSILDK